MFKRALSFKIICLCCTVSTLFLLIFLYFQYQNYQDYNKEHNISNTSRISEIIAEQISSAIDSVNVFIYNCTFDPDILTFCEETDKSSPSFRLNGLEAFSALNHYYNYSRLEKYINKVVIASNDQRTLICGNVPGNTKEVSYIEKLPCFQNAMKAGMYYFDLYPDETLMSAKNKRSIAVLTPIKALFTTRKIGWMYVSLSPDILTDIFDLSPLQIESGVFFCIDGTCYQYDGEQLLPVSEEITFDVTQSFPESHLIRKGIGNRDVIALTTFSDGWNLFLTVPENPVRFWESVSFQENFWIPVICAIVVIFVIYILLEQWIVKPIKKINDRLLTIASGNLVPSHIFNKNDEFEEIELGINHMVLKLDEYIKQELKFEQEKSRLEFQLLQHQINPHFFYNSLNTIKYIADIQNISGISEISLALVNTYKQISKNTSFIISLEEELKFLDNFIIIQRYRYEDAFIYKVKIDEPFLLSLQILKFSLQPLVENAIFHGIGSGKKDFCILLSAQAEDQDLVIHIRDNGIGMSPQQIYEALNSHEEKKDDILHGIGIKNINHRIRLEYGESYGISIQSEIGKYTDVTIRYPMRKKGDVSC